mmetsp:Transcript_6342/g.9214  ORF Transcript_6342/g.9214 Transcript_6342/m.9214 type:complete len:431 (+) Transcript_6342:51-1343(+)
MTGKPDLDGHGTTTTNDQKQRRLILHFDVNETLLIEDVAGGDSTEDCLNKILAKNAFIRGVLKDRNDESKKDEDKHPEMEMLWWDGTPVKRPTDVDNSSASPPSHSTTPPSAPQLHTAWEWPEGCIPYYRIYRGQRAKTFTLHDGAAYRPLYDKMCKSMQIKPSSSSSTSSMGTTIDDRLSKDGGKTYLLLPSFFECIYTIDKVLQREYSIVIRTFGHDLSHVANAIRAFAEGRHPDYPDFTNESLILDESNMYRGRWKDQDDLSSSKEEATYHLYEWNDDKVVAKNDDDILRIIENRPISGIQDDYQFWSKHECSPRVGKPVWVRGSSVVHQEKNDPIIVEDRSPHHIIFDDNIQNDPLDSIVAVRYQQSSPDHPSTFRSLSGNEIRNLHGKHLVRVPTFEPMLDKTWFLRKIACCELSVAEGELKSIS